MPMTANSKLFDKHLFLKRLKLYIFFDMLRGKLDYLGGEKKEKNNAFA